MKVKLIILASIATLALTSCNEDFLDAAPSDKISAEQIKVGAETNPDIIEGTVSGLYSLMYIPGTGGTTNHDDYGQKGVDMWTDMLSADIAHSRTTYGWYRQFSALQSTVDFTSNPNYQVWRYYYRIIRNANKIIDALGGNDAVPALQINKYNMGQAKAMRAYSYFYLTQTYADSYDPGKEILPLLTNADQRALPKSKTSDIYALIFKDLNESLVLLNGFNRSFKSEVNQDVVKILLAYAYASRDADWDKVQTLTNEVINGGGYTVMKNSEALAGFNNINAPGWIWGSDITIENNISLASFFSQMDYFTYGYQSSGNWKSIDKSLYDQIPANDVRKSQFHPAVLINWRKFYDPARVWDGQRPVVTDVSYMRIAEVYLLNAEAAMKNGGDVTTARTSLKTVLSERVPNISYIDALSGQALTNEILLQTRIELWGEGKSYLLMKRNKSKIKRGSNHLSFVGVEMNYDDNKLSFEIPQSEIQNNPFITGQN